MHVQKALASIIRALRLTVLGLIALSRLAFGQGGGTVLPASAHPHGYTLTDMAAKLALFDFSYQLKDYPETPFQILYENPDTLSVDSVACPYGGQGLGLMNSNTFTVSSG